jgi:hypothetical protein
MLTSRTIIGGVAVLLSGCALVYGLGDQRRLTALFRTEVSLSDTVALEGVRGARAGEMVTPREAVELVRHRVVAGDTWWRIAKQYGVLDYNELARHHDFVPLKPGMVIEIPPELREGL